MTLDRLASDPRVTVRRPGTPDAEGEAVVYWMERARRAHDNPALDLVIALGNLLRKPVVVFFAIHPFVERANLRHYTFLAEGLRDLADGLRRRRVGFELRTYPNHRLLPFLQELTPAMLVGDENPLRRQERWRERVGEHIVVPFWTVDADVVVPSALLETEQYAARTIRPRVHKYLAEFLEARLEVDAEVPTAGPRRRYRPWPMFSRRCQSIEASPQPACTVDISRRSSDCATSSRAALAPTTRGAIAPRWTGRASSHPTCTLVRSDHARSRVPSRGRTRRPKPWRRTLEQLIVRRELAVNYVRYNDAYDRLDGCERWARQTLRQHRFDRRPHVYSAAQFEAAETHDPLWNAAQRQMVTTGWMHGYVRMYWAKKILEWSATPEEAFATAVTLNDRYELDGRDPNGYANIAWAICGKHDRPWPPRPVYGTIRSMTFASTSRKFDVARYIAKYSTAGTRLLFPESK